MSKGVAAPTDPVAKRPFFYLIREKEIFASPQPDGKGIQFLYQDNGRLTDSARITGNISDQSMLNLLETTEGFRKLVHSIGVTVSAKESSQKADFVFQMYGKTDIYHSGTSICHTVCCDGMENRYVLEEENWSEDDNVPGQIRFVFDEPETVATVNVKLYLNDGFEAPEVIEDFDIDYTSKAYRDMIARSVMSMGNTAKIKSVIDRAKNGEQVTLAYIGGSITQGAGAVPIHTNCYAYRSYKAFADQYGTGDNVRFVKAGVGGTASELGVVRFERDILNYGKCNPDLVVVEYAVNDEGDETKGVCYESLVRKILKLPNHPAVILLFLVFSYDWNLQDRLSPVGCHYHLPMISIKDAVTEQFSWSREEGRVLSKNQFFYDIYHPSNVGHRIIADCMSNLFREIDQSDADDAGTVLRLPETYVIGADFEDVHLLDRKDNTAGAVIDCGDFCNIDYNLQSVERNEDTTQTPQFPHNWFHKDGSRPFVMKIQCRALLILFKDSADCDVGRVCVYVDNRMALVVDPREVGWTHCNAKIVFNDKESRMHTIVIEMERGCEDKQFTILGFGYVS
ncbi:MAG: SGNH/GDSL hydrolase family protein [Lachnospiraceae bacterium]|nr:SGNH/GDSL hydrolase family protein [Lachnospiraceae bacterium]